MHENSLKNLRPWHPGQTGNPNGRPISSRNKLTERFLSDVSATWHRHGAKILEDMAQNEPGRFADLAARCIPKDVALTFEARLPGNLSPDEWQLAMECFGAIREALPDANSHAPGQVLQFVKDAIKAHSAPLIDTSGD